MTYTVHMPMVLKNNRPIPLGACAHPDRFANPYYVAILHDYYQLITPEVAGGYWWVYGRGYGWGDMDYLYQYVQDTGKKMIGYPLRWWWEAQPPDPLAWITEIMTKYPGIMDWIVVNEGYWDGVETVPLIRESYIHARAVRPDVRLQYNGLFIQSSEAEKVLGLIDDGLVDAVGIQCHHDLNTDTQRYIPLICELNRRTIPWRVSELDVSIPDTSDYCLTAQAEKYREVVELVRDYGGESLMTWGVGDVDSWQAKYYPLPWGGVYYQEKPAWKVLSA